MYKERVLLNIKADATIPTLNPIPDFINKLDKQTSHFLNKTDELKLKTIYGLYMRKKGKKGITYVYIYHIYCTLPLYITFSFKIFSLGVSFSSLVMFSYYKERFFFLKKKNGYHIGNF